MLTKALKHGLGAWSPNTVWDTRPEPALVAVGIWRVIQQMVELYLFNSFSVFIPLSLCVTLSFKLIDQLTKSW